MSIFPTRKITSSALFIALGILFPVLFHAIGLGSIFLPLFWPVAASAFFLSLPYAVAVAFLTPLLSSLFTGMPPLSPPIMQIIAADMVVLVVVTNLLYTKTKLGVIWALLVGQIASRLALFIIVQPFGHMIGLPPKIASYTFVLQGMPGVLLMLAIIPFLVSRLKKESWLKSR